MPTFQQGTHPSCKVLPSVFPEGPGAVCCFPSCLGTGHLCQLPRERESLHFSCERVCFGHFQNSQGVRCDSTCLHEDQELVGSLGYVPYLKKEKDRMDNLPPPGFSQSHHHLSGLDLFVAKR